MSDDFIDLTVMDSCDPLAVCAAEFANAADKLTKQFSATDIPQAEWAFYFGEYEQLNVALSNIREFAMGRDKDVERLKRAYFDACYGVVLISSCVTRGRSYDLAPLGAAQHALGEAMTKAIYKYTA